MTLNRYSSLPKATIQNTQVLPDLGIIDSALARQQKSYDETASNISKFQSQVSGLQGYGDAAKQYISQIDEDVKNTVASVANQDLGSPEVKNKLNGYVQSIYGDKKLQEIQKVNELRANYEKGIQDLDSKGKLHSNQKLLQDMAWENYSKTGQISPELTQPLYEAADLVSERGKLVSMIKASGSDGIKFLEDGTAYKNSSKGVNDSRISKAVKEQLLTYANSHAGRQEATDYKALVAQGAIDPKKMSFDNYLLNQVMSTAKNYSYSDFSTNMDVALRDKQGRDLKKKEEEATESSYLPAMKGKDLKFPVDSNGDAIVSWTDKLIGWATGEDATGEEKRAFNETIAKNASAAGMSKKEYTEFLERDPNVKVNLWTDTKKIDSESKRFFNAKTGGGDFYTRMLYTTEFPQGISATDYMEEKGLSENELKAGFSVIGYTTEDNPYTVRGKVSRINGEQVIIDDSHNVKDSLAKHRHQANQAKFNGTGTSEVREFNPADGKEYIFTYRADPSGVVVLEDRKVAE